MSNETKKSTVSETAVEAGSPNGPVGIERLQAELSEASAASETDTDNGGTTKDFLTVGFQYPIKRTTGDLTAITLRRPKGGDLRGVKLGLLGEMDVAQFMILVPRIASPAVTAAQLDTLEAPDIVKVFNELMRFFQPAASPTT